jgi:3-oxocholest-4-en-26-oyl-CoA dehydrogenase beta subunit
VDFAITEDQQSLVDLAHQILTEGATHERLGQLESAGWSTFDRELWSRLATAGITGIALPEEAGGAGLGFLELALVLEEVGRAVAPVPAVSTLVTSFVLSRRAPELLTPEALAGVASGTVLVTSALAESGETSPLEPTTTARQDGAEWVLTGEKAFVPFGAEAGFIVVPASSERGLVVALVERSSPGVEVTEIQTTNRQPQAILGLDGVRLPAGSVVTGTAAAELVRSLQLHLTAALCSVTAGACQAALAMTAAYTSTREQFDKPIASFQAVAQRAADAYIDAELVRLTARQAAWRLAEGWPAEEQVAVAKFWAGDGGSRVVPACQHLHGGIGVDLDYPVHRYFVWVKQAEHELGTPTRQLLALGAELAATPV